MSRLLQFVAGWKGYALALAIGLSFGGVGGFQLRDLMARANAGEQTRADLRGAREVIDRTDKAAQITQTVSQSVDQTRERVLVEYRTITERIPVYVTAQADRRVDMPVGFVRLHDAAAEGSASALPDGPGESPDAPSGVALSAVAGTVTGNYEQCHVWRSQLIGWQGWYAEQRAAWAAKPDD